MRDLVPKRIVVPTDFGEPAANALRYASSLAARSGASLVILHADAFIPAIDFTEIPAGEFDFAQRQLVEMARLRLEAHARANVNPLVSYHIHVAINDPANAIVQASESGVDLLVMGTHGRTGVKRMIFGSVTADVMRLASVPVLAVTGEGPRDQHIRRIACPVTFTSACREALRYASSLSDAPIVLLRGTDDNPVRLHDWIPSEIVDRCSINVIPAHASAEEIVGFAKLNDVDLIAIDVSADRRVIEVIRGTIAEKVVQLSGCPVLTVNARAAEANAFRAIARELVVQI